MQLRFFRAQKAFAECVTKHTRSPYFSPGAVLNQYCVRQYRAFGRAASALSEWRGGGSGPSLGRILGDLSGWNDLKRCFGGSAGGCGWTLAMVVPGSRLGRAAKLLREAGGAGKAAGALERLSKVAPAKRRTGVTVLGHYPEYEQVAEKIGARYFSIPSRVWKRMTRAQQEAAEIKFLERTIRRGDRIVLATSLWEMRANSWLEFEIEYLLSKGYRVSRSGLEVIPSP
jgi:hypothetical protein